MTSVRFELDPLWSDIEARVPKARQAAVEALADELLVLAGEMFNTKASGGTGADGVGWPQLTDEGLRSRARRRPEYASIIAERKQIADRSKEIDAKVRRRTPSGLSDDNLRRRIAGAIAQEIFGDETAMLKRRRQELRNREEQVIASVSNGLIGVDTGATRAALSSRTEDGSLFSISENTITIGVALANKSSRDYPAAFNSLRTVLPGDTLPESWADRLSAVAVAAFERELSWGS